MDAFERNVSSTTFDIGNVSSVQTRATGQFFLRNAQMISPESDCRAKIFFDVVFSHRPPDSTR